MSTSFLVITGIIIVVFGFWLSARIDTRRRKKIANEKSYEVGVVNIIITDAWDQKFSQQIYGYAYWCSVLNEICIRSAKNEFECWQLKAGSGMIKVKDNLLVPLCNIKNIETSYDKHEAVGYLCEW